MIMYCFHNNSPIHLMIIKYLQMIDLKFAFRSMIDRSGFDRSDRSFSRIVWPLAARRPFLKWRSWKSIGSYPYTLVLCRWSLELIFKAKLKLESGNQKIQYGCQAAILKVTSLKINRLLPMTIINMHMKFEIVIPKQTWLMLRKPCRLQTDGRTDGRTDGQGESSILRWAGV